MSEFTDLTEILQINLRSLKKSDRQALKTEKKDRLVQPCFGLGNAEFREKFTLLPYQKVFSHEKVSVD